jgi:hypothetical protein
MAPATHVPALHVPQVPQLCAPLVFDRMHVPLLQNCADWHSSAAPMHPDPGWLFVELAHAPCPLHTPDLHVPVHSCLTSSLTSLWHACDTHFSQVAHPRFVQQCASVPLPPAVQMSTQLPVAVSQRKLAPQVTPVQRATHMPDVGSHFCPGHETP